MSAIRTLLLGLLNDKKPRHGYEIKQELESWNAEKWANISYGSIYFALKKMEEENLLKSVDEVRSISNKPDRNLYEITQSGTEQFLMLLRKQWWEMKPIIDPFQVPLTFMNYMSNDELIAAFEYRMDSLKIRIKSLERMVAIRIQDAKPMPAHIAQNLKLNIAHSKTELEWIEETLKKVKQGELP